MTLNFRVVEGEPEDYWDKYEEFIRLYNDNRIPVRRIKEKLGLRETKYNQYRNRAIEENKLELRYNVYVSKKGGYTPAKYYHETNCGTFHVQKWMGNRSVSFGTYRSERIAKEIVKKLKEVNWNKDELHRIRKEVLG